MNQPDEYAPPQNLEAEEHVLGSMLLSDRALDVIADEVTARDFYRPSHALIYRAALSVHVAGDPVDMVTVIDELEKRGELEQIGGRTRVHELAALVPATANAAHYARIVRQMAVLREVIAGGREMIRMGVQRGMETAEIVEACEGIVFNLARGGAAVDFVPVGDVLTDAYKRLVEMHENPRAVIGVASGFRDLDRLTSGFQPGNFVVLAARPSIGKTALALGIASSIAVHERLPVALFTLEMSRDEVTQRLMALEGLIDSQKIRNGSLDTDDWAKLQPALDRIERAPLFINDSGLITMTEIRSKARRLKLRHPNLALVVVDYMQLMTSGGTQENRVQEVSQISRQMKLLAGELRVPVLALSQLSRALEQRHDKRPILSDLRESGSIEQDADVVLFIYRDEVYHPEDTEMAGVAELNVAKQRNGPTDTIKLSFLKRYSRFGSLQPPGVL